MPKKLEATEEETSEETTSDEETTEEDSDEDENSDGTEEEEEDNSYKFKSTDKTVPSFAYKRLQRRMRAADRNQSATQKELDKLKRAKMTELEKAQHEAQAAVAELDKFKNGFLSQARTNAFLMESAKQGVDWQDASVALRSLDIEDVEVDENGEVEGMADAVKDLANEKGFLVKQKKKGGSEEDDEEEVEEKPAKKPSGSHVGGRKKGGKPPGQPTDEELRKRFPALR